MVETLTASEPAADGAGDAPRGASSKLTVRLKDEDLAALDTASRGAGMRRTEWAVACLRRRLTNRPQFNQEQAEALLEARRELRRIGVQLRELVKAVRDADAPLEILEPKLAEVEAFQRSVRAQLEGVRGALEGERHYWGSDAGEGA